jgi:AGZA family xanthine/uracil permease-like MFS transporter
VVLAIIPSIAIWGLGLVDNTLRAAGTTAEQIGMAKLGGVGIIYRGMQLLGGGAVLAGMMLGAIAAFIINKDFRMATIYALGAAALSFFGVIHGEKLGWAQSWPVALGYLLLAALCALIAQREGAPSGRLVVTNVD